MKDQLTLGPVTLSSRFILGSGKYTLSLVRAAIEHAGTQIITVAIRRADTSAKENILGQIPSDVHVLANTSGARTAEEAVHIARLAREMGLGELVKLEVIRDSRYLLPDNAATVAATETLANEGFTVLPYMHPDVTVARDLVSAGAAAVMPLGAPIGSNRGLLTRPFIEMILDAVDVPVIVDAGIGRPSQAAEAMELGCAAVMANTAIATAGDVCQMARAFKLAVEAGREAYLAGTGRVVTDGAEASSPLTGFLHA